MNVSTLPVQQIRLVHAFMHACMCAHACVYISVGNFPGNKSISQDGGKYREILGNMESMFLPGYLTLDAMTICSWVIWLIIKNTLSILSIP